MQKFKISDEVIIATPTPNIVVLATILGEAVQNGATYYIVEEASGDVSWIEEQWLRAFNKGGNE